MASAFAQRNAEFAKLDAALLHACASGAVAASVAALLRMGAEPEATDAFGNTALILAAARNNAEAVRVLMSAGAMADRANDKSGDTPLLVAAYNGYWAVARALLAGGADPNLPSARTGMAPLAKMRDHLFFKPGMTCSHMQQQRLPEMPDACQ